MKHRSLRARVGVTLAVASALAFTGLAPATADPSSAPDANDVVGVGSDTIEFVMQDLATAYNATSPGSGELLASWNATGPVDPDGKQYIVPRTAATKVIRPNGSGSGKTTLYGASLNSDGIAGNSAISFARSSSSLNSAEQGAGLRQFPFAVDALKMAVSNNAVSHAPASIDLGTILKIYNGTYTNWSQVPGNNGAGVIHPLIPQSGSGTRSFFEAQLTAAKGATWSQSDYAASVVEVQEHSPISVQGDTNAIVPFSVARSKGLSSIKLEDGWSVQRAVYNVVRQADVSAGWATAIFGDSGYLCSPAAKSVIENDGFQQLASTGSFGVCGTPGQSAATNLLATGQTATVTTLAADVTAPSAPVLTATVGKVRSGDPGTVAGTVDFYDQNGLTKIGSAPLSGTTATLSPTGVPAGSHTYVAKFVPTDATAIQPTQGSTVANVVGATTTAVALTPATSSYGHGRSVKATITSPGATPTGDVTFSLNGSLLGTATLAGGVATLALPAGWNVGSYPVLATYAGNATFTGSSASNSLSVVKSASTITETFPSATRRRARAYGVVASYLVPGSSIRPTGSVLVRKGTTVLARGTLRNGSVALLLPKLRKGSYTLTMTYLGSGNVAAVSKNFTLRQR